jgi:hypothetical protein
MMRRDRRISFLPPTSLKSGLVVTASARATRRSFAGESPLGRSHQRSSVAGGLIERPATSPRRLSSRGGVLPSKWPLDRDFQSTALYDGGIQPFQPCP